MNLFSVTCVLLTHNICTWLCEKHRMIYAWAFRLVVYILPPVHRMHLAVIGCGTSLGAV